MNPYKTIISTQEQYETAQARRERLTTLILEARASGDPSRGGRRNAD